MKKKKDFRLSKLVDNLSHELRTPLSAILGYSELLEKSNNLDDAEKNHLAKIAESGSQLLDVINDIIEISNIESGNIKAEENIISRDAFINEIKDKFEAVARVKEVNLNISSAPEITHQFKGDEKKLKTIVFSLVNNAIKFTENGSVDIKFFLDQSKTSKQTILCINIEDTGVGIAKVDMDHIFKPFWQGNLYKNKGTGLGLATCKKLVSILDGAIQINSTLGKGTKVKLQVPIREIKTSKKTSFGKVKLDTKRINNLKAMVVDDLPINRTLARIMLEMKDFEIIEAENGEEAIDYFEGYKPDVVLMDISMPVMDGIEAMQKIRKINGTGKEIPIIAITAGGHTGSRNDLIDQGFSEYIQKPFKEKELFEKISLFLPISITTKKKSALKQATFKA